MKNLKAILGIVAPSLGTALGGPLGGMAVKAISSALTGKPGTILEDLEGAISNATPDQLALVKKAEAEFKVQMKALDVDLAKINAEDRSNARAINHASNSKVPAILAITTVAAFFSYIGFVTFVDHNADIGLINVAIGWLGGSASAVISYYFGASVSAEKEK
jgi:hypothetical protein|tara:strand:+ start:1990 stop:2475 length:486 start_codon:yes stop_codon:yes gene_type:complete